MDDFMRALLALSRLIDAATRRLGQWVAWLIVVAAIISAGNAIIRKMFDVSSNSWLELQWWLFSAVFLLAAPWTLALNEHIRIDIVNQRLPRWARNAIEIVGHVFFLLPMAAVDRLDVVAVLPRSRMSRTSSPPTTAACRSGRRSF